MWINTPDTERFNILQCDFVQAEALDLELSVQETLERSATEAQLNDIKALLGRMMFTGKSVHKKVSFYAAIRSVPYEQLFCRC